MSDTLLGLDEIVRATGGARVLGEGGRGFTSVRTDSRLVERGSLFVPLVGEFQDGHKFIPQAVEKGASCVLVRMRNFEDDPEFFASIHRKSPAVNFIAVEDTLRALQDSAARYVEKFPGLMKIAVTGSSGKTTTKEILASIMSRRYRVVTNKGNLNSETGLPLSVFEIRGGHECGIFEMGMNREDEIGEISAVLKPRYAIVTNIGTAHIGRLGSRENIAREKAKVFDHFHGQGIGVIPAGDDFSEFLSEQIEGAVVRFGGDTDFVRFISDLGFSGTKFSVGGIEAVLSLPGRYNYRNALAAISMARALGVGAEEIAAGISGVKPMFGRTEILEGEYTIVQDCYNANPDSMEKAIEFVLSVPAHGEKVLVLGDMLELGDDSEARHRKIGEAAAESAADKIFFVGNEMKAAFEAAEKKVGGGGRLVFVEGREDSAMERIASEIRSLAPRGSVVLVKGSRGMELERVSRLLGGEG